MLKIVNMKVKNWAQHRSRDLAFEPGIVSVTGANGSGKSNLVRALFFGLAGEVLGSDRREDMLTWDEPRGSVELTLSDGNHEFTVTRTIHDGKHVLDSKVYGRLTRKTEVNDLLGRLIGLDVKLLPQVAFVPQGELMHILTQEHGERARLLHRLFGLDEAERLREALLLARGKVANLPSRAAEIKAAEEQLAVCVGMLEQLAVERGKIDRTLDGLLEQRPMFELARNAPARELCEPLLQSCRDRLADQELVVQGLTDTLGAMPAVAEPPEAIELARLQAHECLEPLRRDRDAAQARVEQLAARMPVPPKPTVDDETLLAIRAKVKEGDETLRLAEMGVCPRCKQVYSLPPEELAHLQADLACAKEALAAYEQDRARHAAEDLAYRRALDHGQREMAQAQANLELLARQVREATELVGTGFDPDAVRAKVLAAARSREAMQARHAREMEIEREKAKLPVLKREVQEAERNLAASVPVESKAAAAEVLGKIDKLVATRQEMEKQEAGFKATQGHLAGSLVKLRAEEAARGTGDRALRLIDQARDVLHPDNLPRAAGIMAVRRLNAHLCKYITLFQAPFELELGDDLDFRCSFSTKGGLPASVLSGGQRVVAALAFRFALLELLTCGCGVLVLDEPTAYLDEDNQRSLLDVLRTAGNRVRAQGVTVLVPTHEDRVASACTGGLKIS